MDRIPPIGRVRGPDFRHYWENRRRPGLFRLWPLPWPSALKPASWLAVALSLLTMAVLMAVAILVAWLMFRHSPVVEPDPLIPPPDRTFTVTVTPTTPPPGSEGTASPSTPGTPSETVTVPTPGSSGSPATPEPGDRF
jgi:hypothetical protein